MTRAELADFVRAAGMGVAATSDTAGTPEAALAGMAASLHRDFAVVRVRPERLRYYHARPAPYRVSEGSWVD